MLLARPILLALLFAMPLAATPPAWAEAPACRPDPRGGEPLYLRGGMNGWGARPEYAFQYACNAYFLNVEMTGRAEFKISDAEWRSSSTFGSAALASSNLLRGGESYAAVSGEAKGGANNLSFPFAGAHTIRVVLREDGQGADVMIGPKTFPDKPSAKVSDPVALSLRFDSRDPVYKRPFGAQAAGQPIDFRLAALPGADTVTLVIETRHVQGPEDSIEYSGALRLPMRRQDGAWQVRHAFRNPAVYGYYFEIRRGGQTYIYQNNRQSVYWTRERGANGLGEVALPPASRQDIRRFRHTTFAADYKVPGWARDAVYYYIFPERFRNGDPGNDPRPGAASYQDKPIEFHRNWLDKPYRPGSGDGSDNWANNDFFGGDLAGIIEKLDYIAGLGANIIYMTPVFKASSNHKYDTADYMHIDPGFGTDEDFGRLIREAGKRGIRILPDTSLNHTGSDSLYFDRYAKYDSRGAFRGAKPDPRSPYASWYRFHAGQNEPNKQYTGWAGTPDLPELDKSSPDYRRFAFGAPDSVTRHWMAQGTAGWRMDVAPWVPDDFWRGWRKVVKAQDPNAITVAETWFDASKYFLGDTFDSTMNYIFRNTVLDYASGIPASAIYHNLELIREVYPAQAFYALMNVLSTHDVARSLHYLGETEHAGGEQRAMARQRYRLAVLFQMTFPGAPAIYYGDEAAMSGGDDPLNRAGYPWPDRGGTPDQSMLAYFQRLVALRKQHAVLRHGSIGAPLHLDEHVIVLARKDGAAEALTATNNALEPRTVTVALPAGFQAQGFDDALDGAGVQVEAGRVTLTVPPLSGSILIRR